MFPSKTDVVILGAGISGLATAHFLAQKGYKVVILEKSPRSGGAICSERRDGFLIEYGPNSTLDTTPLLREMFADLDIADSLEYANDRAKNRYIVKNGELKALPMSPPAFLKTDLFSLSAKLRLLKEPFIEPAPATADESLGSFVERRLGREFLDYAINPFVAGVYAGKPELLSVKSGFPKLYALEQEYGSLIKGTIKGARKRKKSPETAKAKARLLSFSGGLQTMTDALTAKYAGQVFFETNIRKIKNTASGFEIEFSAGEIAAEISSAVLLSTIPAFAMGDLPYDFDQQILHAISNIYYPPVSMVYFGFKQAPPSIPLGGFGFLVPEKEHRNILGTIWSSTIFKNRAPDGGIALTTFVGGSRQPQNARLPESELIDLVQHDLKELMGIQANPDLVVVKQWEKAIPQYQIGHQQIVDAIHDFEKNTPGFYISGNFHGGISVGDCVKNAMEITERISTEFKPGTVNNATDAVYELSEHKP